jgi:hypothetical protein
LTSGKILKKACNIRKKYVSFRDEKQRLNAITTERPMLSGITVTTVWHILRLWTEEKASRYGG